MAEIEATRRNAATPLDIHDTDAHRLHIFGQAEGEYIGNEQLCWEFMRRSRLYRQDFLAFMSRWQNAEESSYRHLFEDEHAAICEKWHLWTWPGLSHPDSASPPRFKAQEYPKSLPPHALHIDGETIDLTHGSYQDYSPTISVRFFLDSHIVDQIDRFKKLVTSKRFQKCLKEKHGVSLAPVTKASRRSDKKYPVFLRILDAQMQDMDEKAICWLIHGPGSKPSIVEIDKDIDRANELADRDFIRLLDLTPVREKSGT